ncbi:sulfate transporter family-domain-containing protein [Lipomyces japonicus]|uniref:sulfate transporter family-domain-containing protein n=1 Tax=Lipomyces japonicus TaxID=56871 RepID=UPI0034CD3F2F
MPDEDARGRPPDYYYDDDSAAVMSVRSTASFLDGFRARLSSFVTAGRRHDIDGDDDHISHHNHNHQYTRLDQSPVSDSSTILGAPRHRRRRPSYGACMSSATTTTTSSDSNAAGAAIHNNSNNTDSSFIMDEKLNSPSKSDRFMAKSRYYAKYYFPILTWLPEYPIKAALAGDIIAGLTTASFNIPLSLSYARTLCHVPERYGLFGFAFPQLVYSLMGTVPIMVVGPEPAMAVMVGQAVVPFMYADGASEYEAEQRAIIYVALISLVSAVLYLVMGFLRLGFLDSVLSTSLLRGFIASVGVVLTMDTLIQGLGLSAMAAATGASTGSAAVKLGFILSHLPRAHALSTGVFLVAFGLIMLMRFVRARYGKKFKFLLYFPDILLIVIFSIVITYKQQWNMKGMEIVGQIDRPKIEMMSPLTKSTFIMFREILPSALIIGLLGFYSSAVIAKNIFPDPPTDPTLAPPKSPAISSNRELVALGAANLLAAFMYAVPVIGGYGRTKSHKLFGARTQLASIVFAFSTIIVTFGMLSLIYYLPRPVLAAVLGLICAALLEDAPSDFMWYCKMRAWGDLAMFLVVIGFTLGTSLQTGVTIGLAISVIQILKHTSKAKIQVLARVPGTASTFRKADDPSHDTPASELEKLEHLPGVLLIHVPEALTFANTSDLENRIRRLQRYGTMKTHPSLPAVRDDQNIVFDMAGMTDCDTTAVRILLSIVATYSEKGKHVLFARVPTKPEIAKLFKLAGLDSAMSYNGHAPAYFATIEAALQALDECVYDSPGTWAEQSFDNDDDSVETEVSSVNDVTKRSD